MAEGVYEEPVFVMVGGFKCYKKRSICVKNVGSVDRVDAGELSNYVWWQAEDEIETIRRIISRTT